MSVLPVNQPEHYFRYADFPLVIGVDERFGYGDPPPQTIIAVGFTRDELSRMFASCTWAANLPHPYGVVNHAIDQADVWICRDVSGSWPAFWKNFQSYG